MEEEAELSLAEVLEPLSPEEMDWLSERTPRIRLGRGQIFYTPGLSSKALFLLLEGRMRVYKAVGGQELTLHVVEAGEIFGEAPAFAGRPQGAYAEALEPSRVALVGPSTLERLVRGKPEVGLKIMRLLGERLYIYESRMADIALKEVPARLASLILRLVESEGEVTDKDHHYRIPTRYTHEQLATMIGARRVAVTKAFAKLREAGALELRRRHIHVTDLELLKRAAEAQ